MSKISYETGSKESYFWIEFSSADFNLIDLVRSLPNLLIDRYIGIVAFDGCVFIPSESELKRNWYKKGEISYSPILNQQELDEPIYECYDQWCIFKKKAEFEKMTDFVNYGGFTLRDQDVSDSTTYKIEIQKTFWKEVEDINPDSIIINGDFFIFCSKEEKEIKEIIRVVNT
ncbi:hypothetical protein [Tenacibaculum agarivorans]|uniref:hypothetical protein n=1 Tax=Tenacibaculum agarivorans TaxID=1908389 RepID=UPI00094B81EC|nr:hypothetical protein [Tenacibaculum agarivorans]